MQLVHIIFLKLIFLHFSLFLLSILLISTHSCVEACIQKSNKEMSTLQKKTSDSWGRMSTPVFNRDVLFCHQKPQLFNSQKVNRCYIYPIWADKDSLGVINKGPSCTICAVLPPAPCQARCLPPTSCQDHLTPFSPGLQPILPVPGPGSHPALDLRLWVQCSQQPPALHCTAL